MKEKKIIVRASNLLQINLTVGNKQILLLEKKARKPKILTLV